MKHIDYVAASRGKYLWYADYLHQIEPYVKVVTDVENRARPKYLITNHSVEMIDDGIHPEDREMIRAAKQHIETIRQRFEDQFYYDQRRNKQTTVYPYPRTEGRNSPDDPGD